MFSEELLNIVGPRGKKIKWTINKGLAEQQKLDDKRLIAIGDIYRMKDSIETYMRAANTRLEKTKFDRVYRRQREIQILRSLFKEWKLLEFCLQALWRFELDEGYHKDYLLPGCACPKMDNNEMYPSNCRVVSADCILHGDKNA